MHILSHKKSSASLIGKCLNTFCFIMFSWQGRQAWSKVAICWCFLATRGVCVNEFISLVLFMPGWHSKVWYQSITCFCKSVGTNIFVIFADKLLNYSSSFPWKFSPDKANYPSSGFLLSFYLLFVQFSIAGQIKCVCHLPVLLWDNNTTLSTFPL